MRKLVAESIEEALKSKENLNEGIRDVVKGILTPLRKIGKFFLGFYKGKILPVLPPINLGILYKNKELPKSVSIFPSIDDIELDKSLASLANKNVLIEKTKKREEEYAKLRAASGGLQRQWELFKQLDVNESLNEEKIGLAYKSNVPHDKIRSVGTSFLIKRILLQVADPSLIPPLIWGGPGIGKTAITNAVVKSLGPGHRLIDVQTSIMAPDDWTLPAIVKGVERGIRAGKMVDVETTKAVDIPKNWLPLWEPTDDPEENARRNDIANWGEGGVIFLDELSRAPIEVQNTCLKLVNERGIGGKKLGSKWAIISATNRELDDPQSQNEIGSALANRFQHFNFMPSVDEWIEWGTTEGINPRILTFVDFNRDHFYLFDPEVKVNTTPRTWEALSKALAACEKYKHIVFTKADLENMIGATIHSKTYEDLIAFMVLIERFHPNEIKLLFTDPKKAPKPVTKSGSIDIPMARALIGASISNTKGQTLKGKDVENFVQYWIDLGNRSLASAALYLLVEHHDYIHAQIGEDPKKAEFKKAMDMFRVAFGGIKFANMNRADIMGNVG